MYRVLVSGSSTWSREDLVIDQLEWLYRDHPDIQLVTNGCPTGAEAMVRLFAQAHLMPIEIHPENWNFWAAGRVEPDHATEIAEIDECVMFIKNNSLGAELVADMAERRHVPITRIRDND